MKVDINFHPKEHMAFLIFEVSDFSSDLKIKECLAIITVFCGDFYLDPELEVSDIQEFIEKANEKKKTKLLFELSEEGLELELQ